MPKTRMSVVDCLRMATEVNTLLAGSWVQNIYTTEEDSAKTFLFKLTGRGDKYFLLLESGVRFHPTEFVRDKSEMPTGFAMKLRKHVRGRRLEYCRQVGLDRVVDFAFGKGNQHHHVVLEMYAGGNVILTDEKGIILTLLRPYTLAETATEEDGGTGAGSIRVAVGQKYPFDLALEGPRALLFQKNDDGSVVTTEQLEAFFDGFITTVEAEEAKYDAGDDEEEEEEEYVKPKKGPSTVKGVEAKQAPAKRKKKKDKKKRPAELEHRRELAQALASKGSPVQSFGPQLIEHCLCKHGFNPKEKIMSREYGKQNSEALSVALKEASRVLAELSTESSNLPGYIVVLNNNKDQSVVYYDGFEPYAWSTTALEDETDVPKTKEFPSFYQAVDEFYAKIESQKAEKARLAFEKANLGKIENVRKQQAERVEQLTQAVEDRNRAAEALERNVDLVNKVIQAISSLVASGMSWDDVDRVVKQEKRQGNPVASVITSLKLNENKLTVALAGDAEDESEDEEEEDQEQELQVKQKKPLQPKKILVEVNIGLTAQANVSAMFADKKKAAAKAKVTIERSSIAVEDMQSKLAKETKKKSFKPSGSGGVKAIRKPFWFEKFLWFLTSEGVLVLAGRDAHQNEMLFKRFLRKGDAYMHADIHGAPTCIVRNPFWKTGSALTIPTESMRQAGIFCVCRSSAWQAKIITSAWWVESNQVSRTAPSGEYLSTGSFMIRGKKNYLQPTRLEMGFGYIFRIDLTAVDAQLGDSLSSLAKDESNTAVEEDETGGATGGGATSREREWRYLKGVPPPPPTAAAAAGMENQASAENDKEDEQVSVITVETTANSKSAASAAAGSGRKGKASGSAVAAGNNSKSNNKSNQATKPSTGATTGQGSASSTHGAAGRPQQTQQQVQKPSAPSKKKQLKMKRAEAKYAGQSEEERRMAMIALGHALPEVEKGTAEDDDNDDDEQEKGDDNSEAEEEEKKASWLVQSSVKVPGADGKVVTNESSTSEGKEGVKTNNDADNGEEDEDDEDEPLGVTNEQEEEEEEPEQQEADGENELLKGFTAIPQPDDVLLYAIPFCGPIESMAHFKFRVKLTPGTLKKGKAAKQAVALFQNKASDRERAIVNQVSDPENVAAMMMEVKVSAPGIEKVRANIKNQKQKEKQELNAKKQQASGATSSSDKTTSTSSSAAAVPPPGSG